MYRIKASIQDCAVIIGELLYHEIKRYGYEIESIEWQFNEEYEIHYTIIADGRNKSLSFDIRFLAKRFKGDIRKCIDFIVNLEFEKLRV